MKTEIYIATHKDYNFPKLEGYIPIQVGKAISDVKLDIIGDNTGENISELNPYFCELTALYWMWKNSTADILGLVHYRRYFSEKNQDDSLKFFGTEDFASSIRKNPNTIFTALASGYGDRTIREEYFDAHIENDWLIVQDIILHDYPEYLDSFLHIEKEHYFPRWNMFVCHKNIMDKYCSWIFDILLKLHKKINYLNRDTYQQRALGFMSERIFSVFLHKHREILNVQWTNVHQI